MTEERIMSFVGRKTRWFCNRCRTETRHTCKAEHFPWESPAEWHESTDGTQVQGIGSFFRLWICDGCDEAILQQSWGGCRHKDQTGETWYADLELEFALYPARTENSVPVRKYSNLPPAVANVYYETVFAHHHWLYLLCALGLRSLVEAICADRNIEGKTLEERINGLQRVLPKVTAEKLHALRFIGNRAAHEFREPKPNQLLLGIEICEDMLNFFYEMEHRASQLAQGIDSGST